MTPYRVVDPAGAVELSAPRRARPSVRHVYEDEIAGMTPEALRAARSALARLIAKVDARLAAVAAAEPPSRSPYAVPRRADERRALAARVDVARAAITGKPDERVKARAAEVKARMEGKAR